MIRKPLEIDETTPWQELTIGGEVAEGGTARVIKTGEWRSDVPRWDADKCKHCLLCAPYCPDVSILVTDGRLTGIDYDHCKGCGICAKVCPFGAIHMEKEGV